MSRPKLFRAQMETITHDGQSKMRERANLEFASSGNLISELERRGYRVFPAGRVIERPEGWIIPKWSLELKAECQAGPAQLWDCTRVPR